MSSPPPAARIFSLESIRTAGGFFVAGLIVILWILRGREACRMRFRKGAQRMLLRLYPNGRRGEG